jgi:RNA polymerase sigma-70 factor, ECF subfamily
MLGTVMDAEDIVQEVFLLLGESADQSKIINLKAYLCKIVTNRCIDKLRSSAKKREVYVGPWLPEPLVEGYMDDPSVRLVNKESISTAYLLMLQQLTEIERAVFLLREVFQYDYDEIASMVDKSSSNCRQIFHRARKRITFKEDQAEQGSGSTLPLVENFTRAVMEGNITQMLAMLKDDSVFYSDGGGKEAAALRPIYSADYIARMLLGVIKKLPESATYKLAVVNGGNGIIVPIDDKVKYVVTYEILDGKIASIYMVANPDKLQHLNKKR